MNPCPSPGTYCSLNLGAETCMFYNTDAECPQRKTHRKKEGI